MSKADLDTVQGLQAKQAAKLLLLAYRRQKVKSWDKVARRYGLTKGKAYGIAHGTRRPNPETDHILMRAIKCEFDIRRRPAAFRRFIRKVAVPFLQRRQRSRLGVYGRGGRHVDWED